MEQKRACTLCNTIKLFSEFNWDKRFNIPFSRCKLCFNAKCREYRHSQQGKDNYRKWLINNGRKVRAKAVAKWRQLNKNKRSAHTAVSNAIRDGRLFKEPCNKCQNPIAEAHHTSYDKENWLNVTWLCKLHHTVETYSTKLR